MRTFLFSFAVLLCLIGTAQDHPTCDATRYLEDVFVEIDSTMDIKYGEGNTIADNFQELYFNLFEPKNDTAEKRPVIVFAYGGSFIGGTRTDVSWICKRYARKGFVAVALEYRLYDLPVFPIPTEEEMKIVVTKSVADFKGAIRYLKDDANTNDVYRIDPNFIFVGGISAGAIAAAHAAHLDETDALPLDLVDIIANEGGLDGTVNDLDYPTEVQGFINFSGGLNEVKWLDANDPPFVSVHEIGDATVPYGDGFANIFGFDIIALQGSETMERVADSLGVKNVLRSIDAETHVGYFANPMLTTELIDLTSAFLHDLMCEDQALYTNQINILKNVEIYPNPTNGKVIIEHDYGNNLKVNLYNSIGQQIAVNLINNALDLSLLESGIYYLHIKNLESNKTVNKKIILN